MEHPDTILAIANLAVTYYNLDKYTESKKMVIQVLDARKRVLGVQHSHIILAMESLSATLDGLGKYKEADGLVIQAQVAKSTVTGATSHYTIATIANVQKAQETSTMNFEKKGAY